MPNPLEDITSQVSARVAVQLPNIHAAVDAAMHPAKIGNSIESALKDLPGQIDSLVAAKIAACIKERLGAGLDAHIGSLINGHINDYMATAFNC